jgi:hypothetical protein
MNNQKYQTAPRFKRSVNEHIEIMPYQKPTLEQHNWVAITGISIPIGTNAPSDPLEIAEIFGVEQ